MKRRRALTALLALAAVPSAGGAQPTGRALRIVILDDASESSQRELWRYFRERLAESGFVEGRNLLVEMRYADGATESLPAAAREAVALKPDLIVARGTPSALAAKQATAAIPIVFLSVADPVRAGLAASLSRPGGNLTFAARQKFATVYPRREYVEAGGLMSYGAQLSVMYQRAAGYVEQIARGARPAELPVERPSTVHMVVNLKTARAQGIKIPQRVLVRADRVIE